MAQIHVAKTGNNTTGNGSAGNPYLTIVKAINVSTTGDEIIVGPGTYSNEDNDAINPGIAPKSGTTLRAATVPVLDGTTWSSTHATIIDQTRTVKFGFILANKTDITIEGFEVKNALDVNINLGGSINSGHTIRGCLIHHCNGNGINVTLGDRLTIEGNEIHNCAEMTRPNTSTAQSGLSLLRSKVQSGADLAGGYRTRILNNYIHHSKPDGGQSSDGNGIIIDKLHYYAQTYGTALTLLSGNICAFNRGSGIRIMASKNCVVEYNTCYGNMQITGTKTSTWGGEIQAQWARENTYRYNIGVATEGDASNHDSGAWGNNGNTNPDYADTQPGTGNTIEGNIFFAIAPGTVQNVTSGFQSATSPANQLNVNPLLVDPDGEDFTTEAGSPARGAAAGGLDIGAWQSGAAPPDTPVTITTAPVLELSTPFSGGTFELTLGTYSDTVVLEHQAQYFTGGAWTDVAVTFGGTNPLTGTIPDVAATGGFRIQERYTGTGAVNKPNPSNWIDISPAVVTPDEAPVNTVLPDISGTESVGATLTCSTGTWTGRPSPTFTYQWKRDTVNIGGATSSSYLLDAADSGTVITCAVTATNAEGNATATSAGTGAIAGSTPDDDLTGLTARIGVLEGQVAALTANLATLATHVEVVDAALSDDIEAVKDRASALELDFGGSGSRLSDVEESNASLQITISDHAQSINSFRGLEQRVTALLEGGRLRLYLS